MIYKLGACFSFIIFLCIPTKNIAQLFDDLEFQIGTTRSEKYAFIFDKMTEGSMDSIQFPREHGNINIEGEIYILNLLNTKNDRELTITDRQRILESLDELIDKYRFTKIYQSEKLDTSCFHRTSKNGTISHLEIIIPTFSEEYCQIIFANEFKGMIPLKDKSFEEYIYVPNSRVSYQTEESWGKVENAWKDCGLYYFPNVSPPEDFTSGSEKFGVLENASHGNKFISMVTRADTTWEIISQKLDVNLKKDSCYKFSFDSVFEKNFRSYTNQGENNSRIMSFFNNPISLKISLSNSKCDPEEIIYISEAITNRNWKNFTVEFKPTDNYEYIILEAYYHEVINNGNLLLDNFSDIYSTSCSN